MFTGRQPSSQEMQYVSSVDEDVNYVVGVVDDNGDNNDNGGDDDDDDGGGDGDDYDYNDDYTKSLWWQAGTEKHEPLS